MNSTVLPSIASEQAQFLNMLVAAVKRIIPTQQQIASIADQRLAGMRPQLAEDMARAVESVVEDRLARELDQRLPRTVIFKTAERTLGQIQDHVRPQFEEIAQAVLAGCNVLLTGPAGCGKTHLCDQLARALGLRFGFISLSAGISESALIGRFVPTGAGGSFQYVFSRFADFYKNGGLFLLDEIDAADPNVLLVINAALANGHLETPNPDEPCIARHPDFRLVAAANTWGHGASREYVGRNQLDAATLDRFAAAKFALDYDEEFERKAGHPDLVRWAHRLRQAVREHKVRRVVSTRFILDASKRLAGGATLTQVQRSFLLDWSDNELATVGERRPA